MSVDEKEKASAERVHQLLQHLMEIVPHTLASGLINPAPPKQ
jgi:hypothetical protein